MAFQIPWHKTQFAFIVYGAILAIAAGIIQSLILHSLEESVEEPLEIHIHDKENVIVHKDCLVTDTIDKDYLKELFTDHNDSQSKSEESHFKFFRNISTLSVALIGLLIGLKASPIPSLGAKIAFLITIILIGLCILFSLIAQFYEVVSYKKEVEIRRKHILKYTENPSEKNL